MTVERNRLKMIAAVLTGVVVLALGFVLGVQPQLTAATTASEQKASVDQQNETLRAGLATLKADNEKLPALQAELADLQTAVPSQATLPAFLSEISQLAAASGTTVMGFTTSDAVAYAPAEPAAAATDASSSDSTTDGAGSIAAPSAPVATAPELVTDPQITAANFSSIPITVTVKGSYEQARDFLGKLQQGSRLFLVTDFASSGSSEGGSTNAVPDQWTVGGLVYVLQDAAATQADQAAETPATTAQGADAASSDTAAGQ
jgi:Tfp pilus assembly protein PilO